MNIEEMRLMKTEEEVRNRAKELLQMPKVEVLTKYMFQEQEIERLNNELQDFKVQDISNQEKLYNLIEENERLNNIIKEVRNQLSYLETYSSKEDVFDDMKRRLDRIDKIIGSDKE